MGINNQFLLRQSLNDDGAHRRYDLYFSPDLIIHDQVKDPLQFFTDNYGKDVNQPVELSSQFNFLYVRAKNLKDGPNSGYLHVYQCGSSLFMKPSLWKNYAVSTVGNQSYASFHAESQGQIVIADDVFQIKDNRDGKFCLAAVMSTEPNPYIPDDFGTYDQYVNWVYTNSGVCFRNLTTVKRFPKPAYSRADRITGVGTERKDGMITVTGNQLPAGTKIHVQCAPLDLDQEVVYDPQNKPKFPVEVDPGINAYVVTTAETPDGTWPAGTSLEVKFYLAFDANALSYKFGQPFSAFGLENHPRLTAAATPYGRLVLSGSCATRFI